MMLAKIYEFGELFGESGGSADEPFASAADAREPDIHLAIDEAPLLAGPQPP